jgi:hypothetical protein
MGGVWSKAAGRREGHAIVWFMSSATWSPKCRLRASRHIHTVQEGVTGRISGRVAVRSLRPEKSRAGSLVGPSQNAPLPETCPTRYVGIPPS